MSDFCEVVNIIPQYLGTCWFNAILMSCLYSQGASRVFRETALRDDWENSDDPLKVALFNMLSFINRIKLFPLLREEQKRLYQEYLNEVRPEHLILKIAERDKEMKQEFKKYSKTIISLGYYFDYLPIFLEMLGISYLSIFKYDDKTSFKKGNDNPEIIVLDNKKYFLIFL